MIDARRGLQVPWSFAGVLPLELTIALAIGFLQCWLICHHSPYGDELQALLVARQPLGVLFGQLHYEGHPALYYLLLKAITLVSPGIWPLRLTAMACSLATLGLIWSRSPFALLDKVALSLNYLIFFEYGVIARSYGLGVLIFFAFVALRRTHGVGPWILLALLTNVSVHTAILAAICALWLLSEGRWSWKGGAMLGLGAGVAVLTLWPAHDFISAVSGAQTPVERAALTMASASDLVMWSYPFHPAAIWGSVAQGPIAVFIGALFPLIGILALRQNRAHILLFSLYFISLLAFGAIVYVAWVRHLGFAALLMIGLLWAQAEAGERLNAVPRVWMALAVLGGVWFGATALFVPFSAASALSDWAMQTGKASMPWAVTWGPIGLDFSGMTERPIFNLQKGCWNTYQRWNYDAEKIVTDGNITTFTQATGGGYLMSPFPLRTTVGRQLERVFEGVMSPETIYVYHVWPIGPAKPKALPTCA